MTIATETISLRKLVREVAEDTPYRADAFVEKVIERIDPEDYKHYLAEALRTAVQVYSAANSTNVLHALLEDKPVSTGKSKGQYLADTGYWTSLLNQSIPTASGRKRWGDATPDDFEYAAEQRFAHARSTVAEGKTYLKIRDYMVEAGITHLSEGTESELRAYITS